MVWGMFPINPDVSWEGHLWGAVSGVGLAWYYRKYTIRRDKFDWEDEQEEEDGDEIEVEVEAIEKEDEKIEDFENNENR
jgi:hypothetical protein